MRLATALAAAGLVLTTFTAQAQKYPSRDITTVVVWAAGGGHHEVEAHQGWLRSGQIRPVSPAGSGTAARSPTSARSRAPRT